MAVNPGPGPETGSTTDAAAGRIEALIGDDFEIGDEVEVDEPEGEEAEAEEAEPDEQVDESEAEPAEDEEGEQEAIESLSDVAAALGVPVEDLLANLKHTVKVNGETIDVPLSELQAGYQKDRDYRQKTETLKREREQFEAAAMERAKALEESHAQAAFVLNSIEQQIAQSANSQDLERLRQTNPQEWAARRLELQDRLQALNGLKQQAAQSYAAVQQRMQQEQAQNLQKTLEQERQALLTAIPDWNQETNQRLTEFLQSDYGFSPEQVSQVYDHRMVKMAYEAMKWRESQRSSEVTVAKVKKAPRLVKPSTPQTPVSIKAAQVRKLKGKLKQSGHVKDAASLILSAGFLDK